MTKILGTLILVTGLSVSMLPATASAQTSDKDKKKIDRFFKKLKKLPNGRSRPAKVISFSRKLVKLDPKKAKRYYKTATVKFLTAFAERKSIQLEGIYTRLLSRAAAKGQISNAIAKRNIRLTEKILARIILRNNPTPTPVPTPTPYQA
ncbi:MAG: hypothetical protein WA771_03520 [Chthoniobacterales bacterium]